MNLLLLDKLSIYTRHLVSFSKLVHVLGELFGSKGLVAVAMNTYCWRKNLIIVCSTE